MRTLVSALSGLLIGLPIGAQQARVTHAAVVHASWKSTSDEVGRVSAGAVVTTTSHRGGYTHIANPSGWIYSRYLEDAAGAGATLSTATNIPETTTNGVGGVKKIAALPKPTPVEASDATCANVGESQKKLDDKTNLLKNRVRDGAYTSVAFSDVMALPWQGMPVRRYEWSDADLMRTSAYEGAAISVTGYLVEVKQEGKEATNCEKTGPAWLDWHMWLVATLAEAENKDKSQAIVIEATPRVRKEFASRFDIAQLRKLAHDHTQVVVSGWLMLDPDHPSEALKATPSRGTIWEIHPVMKVFPK